jgi:hypothetical protein
MNTAICFPRFGSNEPTPHWGGHKGRVYFNRFPLSVGHLDRPVECFFLISRVTKTSYKENGPRAIWLNRFWRLMINITCGLMCLLVFMFLVHRMLKWLGLRYWGKQHPKRRHYEDQVKSKKRRQVLPRGLSMRGHQIVRWHTALSGATCRTVWCHMPDCPVHPGMVAPTASSRWHYGEKTTKLSDVTFGVSSVKSMRANSRLSCQTNG